MPLAQAGWGVTLQEAAPGLTKAMDAHVDRVEPPEVPGGYLEPSHHLYSREDPSVLLAAIVEALRAVSGSTIDITLRKDKFKLECVAYRPGEAHVPFNARVFTVPADSRGSRYAIEFQRRSGCVMHFAELWQQCKHFLNCKGLCEGAASKTVSAPSTDSQRLGMEPSSDNLRFTVKCLLQMARSQFADVKLEGMQALVKLSAPGDGATAKVMVEEGCVEAFVECVSYPMEDLSRLSISGLANLAFVRAEVWPVVVRKGGLSALCSRVQQAPASPCVQTVRECSRALKGLASHLGKKAYSESELVSAIAALSRHSDPFVHKIGQDMADSASAEMGREGLSRQSMAIESL
jgi:hypothetical protein